MTRTSRGALVGAVAGAVVMAALVVVTGAAKALYSVNALSGALPLFAYWQPRIGPGTVPAVVLAVVVVLFGPRAARTWRLSWLLPAAWVAGVLWIASLALVDGVEGISGPPLNPFEYLRPARLVPDVSYMLAHFVERIPLDHEPHNWPVHVAGHPPGALLAYVTLARLGIDTGLEVGLLLVALGATTPLAVVTTLRALGAESAARRALPLLVVGPAAMWVGVSTDGGLFAVVAAWGLACLAVACRRSSLVWSVVAGLLLGLCVYLSYGLVLLGVLAVAVLVAGRSAFPLGGALAGALAVACGFYEAGYSWFEAYQVVVDRYYDGLAGLRPYRYWVFADLGAFAICAGPMAGVALGHAVTTWRQWTLAGRPERVVALLGGAAWATVLAADVSGMSKAEVERIWLPFVPWALLLVVLLPERWQRWALPVQAVAGLVVQHLVYSQW